MFKLDDGVSGVVSFILKGVTYVKMAIVIMAPSKMSMDWFSIYMARGQVGAPD
jgi:hypothetical protein